MMTSTGKVHHVLQQAGYRYCPVRETEDSIVRPPMGSPLCSKDLLEGYLIYTDEALKSMCVGYNTRCTCMLELPFLYIHRAKQFLHGCFPQILKAFPKAAILYSKDGRPFIGLGELETSYDEGMFTYPLHSPHVAYSIYPMEKNKHENETH